MRSHLTLFLLAASALMLASVPGQAQTYQDYASGRAYVTTAPADGSVTTAAPGSTYRDYASGRAYVAPSRPASPPTRADEGPTYRDYATGRAYTLVWPLDGYDPRGSYDGYAHAAIPVPYAAYGDRVFTPGWPVPPPSITTTTARSRFQPSVVHQMSTTPRTWSWTPSPYSGR
jgi:hypothetical protein